MAIMHPAVSDLQRQDGGLHREQDVLERLQQSLPDNFEIFHSVSWHSVSGEHDYHGEIDIVVMSPSGGLLLVEVKAGDVILRNGEFFKLYSGKEKNVTNQCRMQYGGMRNRLKDAGLRPFLTNCLVLPDYRLVNTNLVAFPKERIIGADEYDALGSHVREILASSLVQSDTDELRHFLRNEFVVAPNLSNLRGHIQTVSRKLGDGMATWIPRITSPSGAFHIQGTAGSGKTQLALRLLSDAVAKGQKSLYLCFNRTLADYIAKIAPSQSQVHNFDDLSIDHYRRNIGEPDFNDDKLFSKAATAYLEYLRGLEPRFDIIVMDEGQDLDPEWVECFIGQLKPSGTLYLMEDEDQRLYKREGFEMEGAVKVTSRENFRSPQCVCEVLNAYGLSSSNVIAKNPYHGEYPELRVYLEQADIASVTAAAVESMLSKGFRLADIAVISWHGRKNSTLLGADHIGRFATTRFTGQFSTDGDPIWTEGDLLVETVYRFKGQSAPAVILTEVDFQEISGTDRNKLFVGLTRAQMAVEIVLSPAAENWFRRELEQTEGPIQ